MDTLKTTCPNCSNLVECSDDNMVEFKEHLTLGCPNCRRLFAVVFCYGGRDDIIEIVPYKMEGYYMDLTILDDLVNKNLLKKALSLDGKLALCIL